MPKINSGQIKAPEVLFSFMDLPYHQVTVNHKLQLINHTFLSEEVFTEMKRQFCEVKITGPSNALA